MSRWLSPLLLLVPACVCAAPEHVDESDVLISEAFFLEETSAFDLANRLEGACAGWCAPPGAPVRVRPDAETNSVKVTCPTDWMPRVKAFVDASESKALAARTEGLPLVVHLVHADADESAAFLEQILNWGSDRKFPVWS